MVHFPAMLPEERMTDARLVPSLVLARGCVLTLNRFDLGLMNQFACECVDFRINGLGTCKHVEAVLLQLECRFRRRFRLAARLGSDRIDLVPDAALGTLRLLNNNGSLPKAIAEWFDVHRLGRAHRVLVVTPASLKTEWRECFERPAGELN